MLLLHTKSYLKIPIVTIVRPYNFCCHVSLTLRASQNLKLQYVKNALVHYSSLIPFLYMQ